MLAWIKRVLTHIWDGVQLSGLGAVAVVIFVASWTGYYIFNWDRKRKADGKPGVENWHIVTACMFGAAALLIFGGVFNILEHWHRQKPVDQAESHPPQAVATAARDVTSSIASAEDEPLLWEDHLGHTYGTKDTAVITHAIQISAKNGTARDILVEDAFLNSGISGEKVALKIGTESGWSFPSETKPIAPAHTVTFRAEFNPPDGWPAQDFFAKWKVLFLTVKVDGRLYHKLIGEKSVSALFLGFRPNPLEFPVTSSQR